VDHHAIVADLKRLASDLKRTPTRDEYRAQGTISLHHIERLFKTYAAALIAAGLQPNKPGSRKRLKAEDIFSADVRSVTQAHRPKPALIRPDDFKSTLVIGDLHAPFVSADVMTAMYEYADRMKPARIVQVGDLYDMFSHGKFPRSRNIYNPKEEIELGFEITSQLWQTFKGIVPQAEMHLILGNHDVRPLKRVIENYPEGEIFFSIDKWFQFEGVTTHMDPREPLDLGEFIVTHGYLSQLGAHRDFLHRNVVCGHSHRGGVVYRPLGGTTLWECNAGLAGDPFAKALGYTPLKVTNWTPGFAYIDRDGPRFIAV